MEGEGRYNANASAQAAASTHGVDAIRAAAASGPLGPAGTVTIVDYGASEGRNSLAPIGAAVEAVRRARGEHQPVWVFHTDLPGNDFGSLFETVADDPDSYRRPGVHTAAVGGSFYEQVLPTGSVSVAWSSIAVHWLSAVPATLDGFWFSSADPARYAAWARAAAVDWRAFLTARAAEMLPGARLVVVVGAAHGDGPTRRSGAERAMDEVARGLEALVDRGVVARAELAAMTIPAWYRTEAEWRAPFDDSELVLEQLELVDLGDPLWQQTRTAAEGSAATYPAVVAAALRVSFGPSLLEGIDQDRRAAVAAELFDGHLARAIAARPPGPWFDWRLAVMVIAKPG
jgi:S-adenosylmethionine-dependent carboxyl methyltransferase